MNNTAAQLKALERVLKDTQNIVWGEETSAEAWWLNQLSSIDIVPKSEVFYPLLNQNIDIQVKEIGEELDTFNFSGESIAIKMKKWGTNISVGIDEYDDPYLQPIYARQVGAITQQIATLALQRASNALNYGDTDTYYTSWDGKQFLSTTHEIPNKMSGFTTFRNLYTTGTAPSSSNVYEIMAEIQTHFETIPYGPNGAPLYTAGKPLYLMCHPKHRLLFEGANSEVTSNYTQNGNEFIYRGMFTKIISNPYLTGQDDVFGFLDMGTAKPFIFIKHEKHFNEVRAVQDISDNIVWHNDAFQFGVKSWAEVRDGNFILTYARKVTGSSS